MKTSRRDCKINRSELKLTIWL